MLREQLVSVCTGKILDAVRRHRGWLSFVSTESQVNRKYFNRKELTRTDASVSSCSLPRELPPLYMPSPYIRGGGL